MEKTEIGKMIVLLDLIADIAKKTDPDCEYLIMHINPQTGRLSVNNEHHSFDYHGEDKIYFGRFEDGEIFDWSNER